MEDLVVEESRVDLSEEIPLLYISSFALVSISLPHVTMMRVPPSRNFLGVYEREAVPPGAIVGTSEHARAKVHLLLC